jgi:hypothetical protein
MTPEIADKLSYLALGISFSIFWVSLWFLRLAREHLRIVKDDQAPKRSGLPIENRDTLKLPLGYHKGS